MDNEQLNRLLEKLDKIPDKLEAIDQEIKIMTKIVTNLNAKDLPQRVKSLEKELSDLKINQARFLTGIALLAFIIPILLKYLTAG